MVCHDTTLLLTTTNFWYNTPYLWYHLPDTAMISRLLTFFCFICITLNFLCNMIWYLLILSNSILYTDLVQKVYCNISFQRNKIKLKVSTFLIFLQLKTTLNKGGCYSSDLGQCRVEYSHLSQSHHILFVPVLSQELIVKYLLFVAAHHNCLFYRLHQADCFLCWIVLHFCHPRPLKKITKGYSNS